MLTLCQRIKNRNSSIYAFFQESEDNAPNKLARFSPLPGGLVDPQVHASNEHILIVPRPATRGRSHAAVPERQAIFWRRAAASFNTRP